MLIILISIFLFLICKTDGYAAPLPFPPSNVLGITRVFDTDNASGVASLVHQNKVLRITDAPNQVSSIWSKHKLDFSKSWKIDSYIYFGISIKDAADGITLTFQSDSTNVLGANGGGLGAYHGNIGTNAFSIEFDTDVNDDSYDKNISFHSGYYGQHIAFVDHINVYENLNFKYLLQNWFPNGLSDGEWKRLTVEWDSTSKIIKYVLSKMNGELLRDGTYPLDPNRFPEKKAYWGFTGATGSKFQTNGVSFLNVPQAQMQEALLSSEVATEGETIDLKIHQNTIAGSWSNRHLIIDLNAFGVEGLKFVEDSLVVDGKEIVPTKTENGKFEVTNLDDLSADDKFESTISLKLKASKYSELKKISIIGSGNNEQNIDLEKNNEVSLIINKNVFFAEPREQLVVLGEDNPPENYNSFVKNVTFEEKKLENDEFTTELINNFSVETIGNKVAKVRVALKSDRSKTIDLEIPVVVVWGNAIRLKGYRNQTISGLSLIKQGDNFKFKATRGMDTDYKSPQINPDISTKYISIGLYTRPEGLMQVPNKSFEFYGTDSLLKIANDIQVHVVELGDIVKINHQQVIEDQNMLTVYTDSKKETPYRENELIAKDSFYEITNHGFRLLFFNQLKLRESTVPIYSNTDYLDNKVSEFIEKHDYESIKIKGFSVFPDTTTAGKKEAKVRVEEKLSNGKIIEYDYNVFVNVGNGEIKLTIPDKIVYKDFSKSREEQIIQRKEESTTDLVLSDNRGADKQGDWKVTAKVEGNKLGISPYFIYRENGKRDIYLDSGEVLIYHQEKQIDAKEPLNVNILENWTDNFGILLKIPSKNNLRAQKYSETIIWNILEGP